MGEYSLREKSKHWEKFNERKHLYKEEYLENFRNNGLSDGLDDRGYIPTEQKEIFADLINDVGESFALANLSNRNVGNSRRYFKVGDKFVDAGQNFHIKWLHELMELVFFKAKIEYVCEIGGGYGSLAQKIRSKIDCRYILIDLPEANILASYYLRTHFPNLKFLLCDEINGRVVDKEQVDKYDFIIIPPWYEIRNLKIDLFINTRSMMEMNFDVIKKYFKFIHGTIADNGFFFNINRYEKNTVGHPIKLSEYPYDDKWNVVSSGPSWRQKHIHQLVTQRIKTTGNIKKELMKIEEAYQDMTRKNKTRAINNLPFHIKIAKKLLPDLVYKKLKTFLIPNFYVCDYWRVRKGNAEPKTI